MTPLNYLSGLLKPAPCLVEIHDPGEIKSLYQYWRIRTFYSMYVGYVFYYFTRKSFSFITPFLCTDLGFDKADLGILASILSIAYGASKFTSGILCDRSNPRYFMALGLIMTGVLNILFGMCSSLFLFALIWGLNGWFQGWGWPPCAKLLTYWFNRKERGAWWSACTTSHTVGGFLIAYFAAYCGQQYGWRVGMYMPGVLCIGVGFFLLNRLRDVPESLGLPPIDSLQKGPVESGASEEMRELRALEQTEHPPVSSTAHTDEPLSVKRILFEQVLNNKYIWMLSASYFFVYLIRSAVNDWAPLYLVETKGYSPFIAAGCVSWFEVGGFIGLVFAGWGSDYWFHERRVPFTILFSVGLAASLFIFWIFRSEYFIVEALIVSLIGFFVFGPQMLVGLAAVEFVDKKAASTSNGFAGCIANIGAACAGFPLMKLTTAWGWGCFSLVLAVCAVVIIIILLPLWSLRASSTFALKTPAQPVPSV